MEVKLDETGMLTIKGENPTEGFALTQWHSLWSKGKATFLIEVLRPSDDGGFGARAETIKPEERA